MNCLMCGEKLAIFRRLSLGDFCNQEHLDLFLKKQNELGVALLAESRVAPKAQAAGTRLYGQFLQEELPARTEASEYVGHGPLTPGVLVAPDRPEQSFSGLMPAEPFVLAEPQVGAAAAIGFGV